MIKQIVDKRKILKNDDCHKNAMFEYVSKGKKQNGYLKNNFLVSDYRV